MTLAQECWTLTLEIGEAVRTGRLSPAPRAIVDSHLAGIRARLRAIELTTTENNNQ